jgi:drug/metabolite transporter (DMT)-like permease
MGRVSGITSGLDAVWGQGVRGGMEGVGEYVLAGGVYCLGTALGYSFYNIDVRLIFG